MKQVPGSLLLILVAAVFSGCATSSHFGKLPTPQEFSKPLPQLQAEYQDLTKYSGAGRDWFVTVYGMPEAEPMVEAWNEPHRKRISPWSIVGLFIHPTTCWYWKFEDKEVKARIDHPIIFGWKPHVWKLKVKEDKEQ